jgi:hypothetical protein
VRAASSDVQTKAYVASGTRVPTRCSGKLPHPTSQVVRPVKTRTPRTKMAVRPPPPLGRTLASAARCRSLPVPATMMWCLE